MAAVLAGCTPAPPADAKAATPPATNQPRESWDIYLLQGSRVGYGHAIARREVESGRDVLRTEGSAHLVLRRGSDTSRQTTRTTSVETPGGQFLRFENEVTMGPRPIRTTGVVRGDKLDIETAATPKESVPFSSDDLGPFAIEQSLLRKPMRPGERRTLKSLSVEFHQVIPTELTAKDYERTKLPSGSLKTFTPALGGLETYRVSRAEALKEPDAPSFDWMSHTMVKVDPPLAGGHRSKEVCYRVHLDGGDPAKVFVTGPTQAVKRIDAHTAEVTVYAIRPGRSDGNRAAPADPPSADDLRPNTFVESDDPLIVADAKKAAGDEKDPWRVAVALEKFVNREVKDKNFTQAFATASEVARSREGDCTEHAVFLMALCRARGIPARSAMGLVYLPSNKAFFYHMWAEAYIDKRWIPIDGTRALGGIGAAHLKIAQSSLKDATAYSAFLPVATILGRLSIKIVSEK